MKKLTLILTVVFVVILSSCGNNTSQNKSSDDTKSKENIKKELSVTLNIGDTTMVFKDVDIRNDAMTPSQKSDDYSICGGATTENGGMCVLDMGFTASAPGEIGKIFFQLKGYKTEEAILNLTEFKTAVKEYNGVPTGVVVSSINGTIKGKIRKDNGLGAKYGDIIEFTCILEK